MDNPEGKSDTTTAQSPNAGQDDKQRVSEGPADAPAAEPSEPDDASLLHEPPAIAKGSTKKYIKKKILQILEVTNWDAVTAIAAVVTAATAFAAVVMAKNTLATAEFALRNEVKSSVSSLTPFVIAKRGNDRPSITLHNVGPGPALVYRISLFYANTSKTIGIPEFPSYPTDVINSIGESINAFDHTIYDEWDRHVAYDNPFVVMAAGEERTIIDFSLPSNFTSKTDAYNAYLGVSICFTDLLGRGAMQYNLLVARPYKINDCPEPPKTIRIDDSVW